MIRRPVVICNKLGLHARAAARFVTLASRFDSHIELARGEQRVNGKSIMGVMMLAAGLGVQLEISAEGADAAQAAAALAELVEGCFGEAE
ncbi:MAG: HPr family phosphocarrier protein [Gammaproteobacteria bacterium]|nr:MAG: HPr family phosphocarrier protein [Gammaproteobacteria bacterium]